jgi:hypothetical protein
MPAAASTFLYEVSELAVRILMIHRRAGEVRRLAMTFWIRRWHFARACTVYGLASPKGGTELSDWWRGFKLYLSRG